MSNAEYQKRSVVIGWWVWSLSVLWSFTGLATVALALDATSVTTVVDHAASQGDRWNFFGVLAILFIFGFFVIRVLLNKYEEANKRLVDHLEKGHVEMIKALQENKTAVEELPGKIEALLRK